MSNPFITLLGCSWRHAGKDKKKFLLVYALIILDNTTVALAPILLGWFIDGLQNNDINRLKYAWLYVGGYLLLKAVYWIFHAPARILEHQLAFKISNNFLTALYRQSLYLRFEWHQSHHSGSIISRIQKASSALNEFLQNNSVCTSEVAKFLFALIAMIIYSPIFGIISFILGVFTVWIIIRLDKPFMKAIDEINEQEHVIKSSLFDSLSNIITVITLRLQERMIENLRSKISKMFPAVVKQIKFFELKWGISDVLIAIIYTVVIIGFVIQNSDPGKKFPMGNFVALVGFVTQFTSVFQSMASYYTAIVMYATNVQTSQEIMSAFKKQSLNLHYNVPVNWTTMDIAGIIFKYNGTVSYTETPVINNVSIRIAKKKKIAIVGESGSGKSTLVALLRGLYDAEPGVVVSVDGVTDMPLSALGQMVTLFPQEPEVFESTIEHNITLGLPTEMSSIIDACELAHFLDIVSELPKEFQSVINEKGVNLSGGQKQRLALARGILAAESSDIILMDEPTSSLDTITEKYVFEKLLDRFSHKAVIVTVHRLYLLRYFDYVYILDRGVIVEEGTYETLSTKSERLKMLLKQSDLRMEK